MRVSHARHVSANFALASSRLTQKSRDGTIAAPLIVHIQGIIWRHACPRLEDTADVEGKLSPLLYAIAIPAAFLHQWISDAIYVLVALIWLIPDRRIERALAKQGQREAE
jgi:hypothetical protein